MPALSLRTLCLCVKPSPHSPLVCGLSAVGGELSFPLSPLFATLTSHTQLVENKATLSPFPATLRSRVKHKSFVCHSYEKHRGVGESVLFFARHAQRVPSTTHSDARISNPLIGLLHNSLDTPGGWGYADRHRPANSARILQLSTFDLFHQPRVANHQSPP